MLSRDQQIRLKRAQQEAGIDDAEYRQALELVTGLPGCRSSKDERLIDRHLDILLAYFEAIFWAKFDRGEVTAPKSPTATFRQRGYWAAKNPAGNTSRDRHHAADLEQQVDQAEADLADLGYGFKYVQAIQARLRAKLGERFNLTIYLAALHRTLKSKRPDPDNCPF